MGLEKDTVSYESCPVIDDATKNEVSTENGRENSNRKRTIHRSPDERVTLTKQLRKKRCSSVNRPSKNSHQEVRDSKKQQIDLKGVKCSYSEHGRYNLQSNAKVKNPK